MRSFGLKGGSLIACLLMISGPAAAQSAGWDIGSDIALSHLSGGARGSEDGEEITIRPDRATSYGIRIERVGSRVGFGIALRHSRPAFAFNGSDVTIVDRSLGFTLYEIAPEVSLRISGDASGPTVRAHAGPVIDFWSWEVTDTYTRLGGRAGLGLELPLGDRIAATVGGAATVSGSMFSQDDIGSDLEPRSTVRTEIGLGLRYRLR